MSYSGTPSQEGPTYEPPALPAGWIAQWDNVSRKYYFVQLSTRQSQWDIPTEAAPTVGTPSPALGGQEPYPQPVQDGQRGAESDRGLGQLAMNQLLGGGGKNKQSSGLMGIAGSLLGGGKQSHGSSSGAGGAAGLVGALAGSLMGSGKTNQNQHQQQQSQGNYTGSYGGQPQQGQQGGLFGKIGGMLGGTHTQGQQNYGYSSGGNQGGYSGQAPPTSYQPPGSTPYTPTPQQHNQQHPQAQGSFFPTDAGQTPQHQQQPTYGAPPQGQQPAYGGPPQGQHQQPYAQQAPYGQQPQQTPQHNYNGPPQGGFPPPPNYGGAPAHTGNLQAPQHGHFQAVHNASHEGGLFGHQGGPPPPPMGSHPNNNNAPGGYGPPGGYGGDHQQGRW